MKPFYPPLLLVSAALFLGSCTTERKPLTVTTTIEKIPTSRPVEQPDGERSWEKTGRSVTVTRIPVGYRPSVLQWAETSIWVGGPSLSKIDPKSNQVVATYKEASGHTVVGGGAIWAFKNTSALWLPAPRLFRIDPATGTITATIRVSSKAPAWDIAFGEGNVWAFQGGLRSGKLYRIDPKTNQIIGTIEGVAGSWERGQLAIDAGAIWAMTRATGSFFAGENMAMGKYSISRIDPAENRVVETIQLSHDICWRMAVGEGALWVTQSGYSGGGLTDFSHAGRFPKLLRIDPTSNRVIREIPVVRDPTGLALGGGSVWVSSSYGEVFRVDPSANKVVEAFDVAPHLHGRYRWEEVSLAFAEGSLWLAGLPEQAVYRIDF